MCPAPPGRIESGLSVISSTHWKLSKRRGMIAFAEKPPVLTRTSPTLLTAWAPGQKAFWLLFVIKAATYEILAEDALEGKAHNEWVCMAIKEILAASDLFPIDPFWDGMEL